MLTKKKNECNDVKKKMQLCKSFIEKSICNVLSSAGRETNYTKARVILDQLLREKIIQL